MKRARENECDPFLENTEHLTKHVALLRRRQESSNSKLLKLQDSQVTVCFGCVWRAWKEFMLYEHRD